MHIAILLMKKQNPLGTGGSGGLEREAKDADEE
jgi:hypothetical protein